MTDLNPNLKINLRDIFRDKFGDPRYLQRYEVVKVNMDNIPRLIFLRNVATNAIVKHAPEQIDLYFIKETNFPSS